MHSWTPSVIVPHLSAVISYCTASLKQSFFVQMCKVLEFGVRCPTMVDGQQEVRKEGGREGGLW